MLVVGFGFLFKQYVKNNIFGMMICEHIFVNGVLLIFYIRLYLIINGASIL